MTKVNKGTHTQPQSYFNVDLVPDFSQSKLEQQYIRSNGKVQFLLCSHLLCDVYESRLDHHQMDFETKYMYVEPKKHRHSIDTSVLCSNNCTYGKE